MIGGKYLKVNGKFIESIGHFAYDGCHKIYILENSYDINTALVFGYYIYPIETIKTTFEKSCPLKFIENFSLTKYYVKQFHKAKWSEVKASKKDIDKIINGI